jgi:low temperature requirement protein LtrA
MATPEAGEERHATWLELYFDLVIVAVLKLVRAQRWAAAGTAGAMAGAT